MEFIKKNTEQINNDKAIKLAKEFNLHEDVVKLLFLRGIDTKEAIDKYINAGETQLYNPFLLKNMKEVVEKINYYIDNKKNILIMGDYDTDGISASAILYKYFEKMVSDHFTLFIRLTYFHGLSVAKVIVTDTLDISDPS